MHQCSRFERPKVADYLRRFGLVGSAAGHEEHGSGQDADDDDDDQQFDKGESCALP
jgi:hypothetical protein